MKQIMLNLIGALAIFSALKLQLSTAFAQATAFTVLTITNPTPAANDNFFGSSLAALGTDRVLISARAIIRNTNGSGLVYLFNTNVTLLTTFTNPTPTDNDCFGNSVAALGNDRVLIGAYQNDTGGWNAGAAYLFSTNGALLTTFTNPTPSVGFWFGNSVAALGSDQVLIGSPGNYAGASSAGVAYLFSTNGALLTTFTNPTPTGDYFGWSVAALGIEHVLIGAPYADTGTSLAGEAYLFRTNGALLTTFTNPTPAAYDYFGVPVAAVGTDRVLIGAAEDDMGAENGGAAYLFSTNGALLTTFTNPTPTAFDYFGRSLAALGTEHALIGAHQDDSGTGNAGAAYLFNTDGTLLTTITNPTPALNDDFGWSVAVVEDDWVLIGAISDDTGATDAGTAYLFSLESFTFGVPSLRIRLTITNTVVVSWPSPSTGWTLQENTNGVASVHWSNAPGSIQDDGTTKTLIVNPPTGNRFYRLFKP